MSFASTYVLKNVGVRHVVARRGESFVESICGAVAHISRVAELPSDHETMCPDCTLLEKMKRGTERLRGNSDNAERPG